MFWPLPSIVGELIPALGATYLGFSALECSLQLKNHPNTCWNECKTMGAGFFEKRKYERKKDLPLSGSF